MSKSFLVHGCWAMVAVGTFAIGTMRSSVPVENSEFASAGGLLVQGNVSEISNATARGNAAEKEGQFSQWGESPEGRKILASRGSLTDGEIEELGRLLRKNNDPISRRIAFSRMLEGLTAENAMLMREQIASMRSDSAEFREFHYAWGAVGGLEAVMNGPETRERDMSVTLAGWASADPSAALTYFKELPEGKGYNRDELQGGMVHGLANTDPNMAADFVFNIASKDGDKGRAAYGLLEVVTGKVLNSMGIEDAARWSENLPDGALRASAMDRVAKDFVASDPEAAAQWAEKFAGTEHNARVIEEVGDEWAERNPSAAVGWLETLTESPGKNQGLSSAFGEWAGRDAAVASEYLVAMPDSTEKNYAINGFAATLSYREPESAIIWADQITDDRLRQSALVRAGQQYYRRDRDGAAEWLAISGLPESAREQVTNPPRRR